MKEWLEGILARTASFQSADAGTFAIARNVTQLWPHHRCCGPHCFQEGGRVAQGTIQPGREVCPSVEHRSRRRRTWLGLAAEGKKGGQWVCLSLQPGGHVPSADFRQCQSVCLKLHSPLSCIPFVLWSNLTPCLDNPYFLLYYHCRSSTSKYFPTLEDKGQRGVPFYTFTLTS